MTEKLYQNRDWLYEQYWVQEKSTPEIAKLAGCGKSTIWYWMKKLDIPCRTLSESSRVVAQDPEWQRKHKEAMRRLAQDPEWRKKQAEGARRNAQDPEWRRRIAKGAAERNRLLAQDPEWRKKQAEGARRNAQDPEWRRKCSEAALRKCQDLDWKRKHAKGIRRRSQDPEWRRKCSEAALRRFQDPEEQEKHIQAMRRRAQDPKWRKQHAEITQRLALKRRNQGQMTSIEAICHTAFESLGLDFVFEKFIYPYRVDFFFPTHSVIVEAMGTYWHKKPKRRKRDAERKQYLEACGYTVLEWWGPDIKADVWKLVDEELLPLLDQPSRMERPPHGVSRPYRGPHGWKSAIQLSLFDKEPDD